MLCSFQGPDILCGACCHPVGDATAQDAIGGAGAKVPEHLKSELKVSEPPQEAETAWHSCPQR